MWIQPIRVSSSNAGNINHSVHPLLRIPFLLGGQVSKKSKTASARTEPCVGIFWLFGREVLFDTTPLSEAETFGDFRIHPGNHISVWDKLRLAKMVPAEVEYEEYPRGRVAFDSKVQRFNLLADVHILRDKAILAKIRKKMHLPKNTSEGSDPHYRCSDCLRRSTADDSD